MNEQFEKRFEVKESDTAQSVGSGGLAVLSTPMMIAYMENAAWTWLEEQIGENETSVGTKLIVSHFAPTFVGKEVIVTIELKEQDKRRYTFHIYAKVDGKPIGEATHTRVVVDAEKFMEQAKK
ncbi:thioesterase family protein [Jeotgalibaca caeni]|uniref:thioesterase family protein n=1 Tax=Jeotgalibaca caeni TaxID=3028623 RepID=UPI00237E0151|nr:thioesterase family protein [Jeotgalibaca caeni]MDE1549202.1 thioesterase family protein [Jeotgalibaca caeni]